MKRRLCAFVVGLFLAALCLEIVLHVYNPFHTRVKGNHIILPSNRVYRFENTHIKGIDRTVVHTKNSLGFRGPELPRNLESTMMLFCVGGSTTECFYISDGETWVDVLAARLKQSIPELWITNAGLDGHSTFGHHILMSDVIMRYKPGYVLFMIGANDIGRTDLTDSDAWTQKGNARSLREWVWEHSEVLSLGTTLMRTMRAEKVRHASLQDSILKQGVVPFEESQEILRTHGEQFIPAYRTRVRQLIMDARACGSVPIFVTQPTVWGKGIDPVTGMDLGRTMLSEHLNGALFEAILNFYNEAVKEVAASEQVPVIDLAAKMPKGFHFFYDSYHFTKAGCRIIGDLLYPHVYEIIAFSDKDKMRKVQE